MEEKKKKPKSGRYDEYKEEAVNLAGKIGYYKASKKLKETNNIDIRPQLIRSWCLKKGVKSPLQRIKKKE